MDPSGPITGIPLIGKKTVDNLILFSSHFNYKRLYEDKGKG